jgi:hypothetical protein
MEQVNVFLIATQIVLDKLNSILDFVVYSGVTVLTKFWLFIHWIWS